MAQHGGGPARARSGVRDIALSMLPLVLVALLLAGLTRACSFSPGGPTVDPGSVPTADATAGFRQAARQLPFPVRAPRLPADWRATSVDVRSGAGTPSAPGPAVRVSWLTPDGRYLRLVESSVEEGTLVAAEAGSEPTADGTVTAAGTGWVAYRAARREPLWVADVSGVRLLLTGDATPREFDTLAAAVLAAPPTPVSG